ncbi:hypothetical protein SUZIE_148455 [Sciurus carolinensis]|uniref:DUF4537 domain-containing protein n=1 Tax=Sciurus carolinensis TaxID=30640 RepID=A0AA41MUS2_SCICA|nr:hypothetical protein [Sciurus carolinensis]
MLVLVPGGLLEGRAILHPARDVFAQILQCGHNPEGPWLELCCSILGPLLHLPFCSPSALPPQAPYSHKLEKQGILLVEYEAPLVMCPNLPPQKQSVVLEEDIIQLSPSRDYSLQPGDKVLAPWEADRQRYGPGTVLLGLESRDPQRASKEEEIIVQFWNGKTAKVPQGGVRWVPPAVWKKAVERLHWPCTRENLSPLLWAPCCSLLGPVNECTTSLPPLDAPFLCPPCQPHACCRLLCQGCFYCCSLMGPTWWPLTRTSEVTAREFLESGLKPTAQLLPLEGPKEESVAVHAPVAVSSSSSSSCEEDSENELEMGLPLRLMVNSAVNTDPILPEKCWRQSGPCQPEWRYWRRNGPEPRPGKPGIPRALGCLPR